VKLFIYIQNKRGNYLLNQENNLEYSPNYCRECGGLIVQNYRDAELTCSNCGLVIRDHIPLKGPEWREFTIEQKEKRCRVGDPITLTIHDYGLTTFIDDKNRDYLGRVLLQKNVYKIQRLRKLQKRCSYSKSNEKSMIKAFSELERLNSAINFTIPRKIREEVALYYRKLLNKGLTKGRSIDLIVTTLFYMLCKKNRIPITINDICENSKFDKKSINRMERYLSKVLNITIEPTNPIIYISRFASQLNLGIEVQKLAIDLINKSINIGISSGRGQFGLIGGALYLACLLTKQYRTQKEIAKTMNITEVTIRNRYKEIVEKLDIKIERKRAKKINH